MTFQRLPEALAGEDRLRELQRQGLWLWQVRRALNELLPPEWCAHLAVGRFDAGQLTVMSPSALVVAKLKQMTPTLIAELNRRGFPIAAIRWRVRPELAEQLPQIGDAGSERGAPRVLSPAAVAALQELLTQLPSDEPLAVSLARWLERTASKSDESLEEKEEEIKQQQRTAP